MDIQEAIQTLSTSQGLESPATSTALSAITSFVGQESSLASPHLRAAALAVLQFVKNNSATLRQQPEDELSLLTAALKALIPLIECTPWPFVQRAMVSKQLPLALRGLTHYHASDPSLSLRSLVVQAYLRILESGASSSYHTSEIRIATDGVISLLAGSDAELTKSTTQRLLDTYLTSNGSNGGSLFAALMAAAATSSEPVPLLAVEEAILDESRFTEEQRQKFLQVMPASYAGKGTAASKKALGEIKEAPLLTDTAEDIAQSLKVLGSLLTEDRTALVNEATGKEILTESFLQKAFHVAVRARAMLSSDEEVVSRAEQIVVALLLYSPLNRNEAASLATALLAASTSTKESFFGLLTADLPIAAAAEQQDNEDGSSSSSESDTPLRTWQLDLDAASVELRLLVAKKLASLMRPDAPRGGSRATAQAEEGGVAEEKEKESDPVLVAQEALLTAVAPFSKLYLPAVEATRKRLAPLFGNHHRQPHSHQQQQQQRRPPHQKRGRADADEEQQPPSEASASSDGTAAAGEKTTNLRRAHFVLTSVAYLMEYFVTRKETKKVIPSWMLLVVK